jgi:hypothetical protein
MVVIKIKYNLDEEKYEEEYPKKYLEGRVTREEYIELLKNCTETMSIIFEERKKQKKFSIINIMCQLVFILVFTITFVALYTTKNIDLFTFLGNFDYKKKFYSLQHLYLYLL